MKQLDILFEETDNDTLVKMALATAAGVAAVAGGRKLYKNYKEKKILKQYGAQASDVDDKHQSVKDDIRGSIPNIIDIIKAGNYLINDKMADKLKKKKKYK